MSEQSFESALAECLAAIDAGTSVEDALARFPAHTEALLPALGLRAALDARDVPLPPTVRARGEQRLQAALAGQAAVGGIPVLSGLFRVLPKAATQALIALVVTGGAIGASAAAGGPNATEVLRAVGLRQETADENSNPSGSLPKGKAEKATATATTELTTLGPPSDASESGLSGLCNAYIKGGLGQNANANPNAKGQATPAAGPLARLDEAAGSQSVGDFCADLLEIEAAPSSTSTAESGNSGRGKGSEKPDKDEGTATPGQGKASEAPGKSR